MSRGFSQLLVAGRIFTPVSANESAVGRLCSKLCHSAEPLTVARSIANPWRDQASTATISDAISETAMACQPGRAALGPQTTMNALLKEQAVDIRCHPTTATATVCRTVGARWRRMDAGTMHLRHPPFLVRLPGSYRALP